MKPTMMMVAKPAVVARVTLALALPLAIAPLPATAQVSPQPAAFAPCLACHTITPGKNGFGPSLAGIAGRKAASLPGYGYSEALKTAGIVWNAKTLDRWLTSPQKMVPGTRMPFTGIADPASRKQVVTYLLSLK